MIELTDTYATVLNSDGYTDGEKVLLLKWLLDRSVSLPERLRGVAEIVGAAQDEADSAEEILERIRASGRERAKRYYYRHKKNLPLETLDNVRNVRNVRTPAPLLPPTPPLQPHAPTHALTPGAGAGAYARGDIPALPTVASVAESAMGVPRWYAEWWYVEMSARDWRNTNGSLVGNQNWRPTLKAWYNRAKPEELEKIRDEHERRTREQQPPANAGKPEYWILCRERCANCKGAGCAKGIKTPPDRQDPAYPPEECPRFQPLPEESPQSRPGAPRSARSAGDGNTPAPAPKRPQRAPAGPFSGCPSPKTAPGGAARGQNSPQEPPRSPQKPPQGSEGTRTGGSPKTPPEAPRGPNQTGSSYQHNPKLST